MSFENSALEAGSIALSIGMSTITWNLATALKVTLTVGVFSKFVKNP